MEILKIGVMGARRGSSFMRTLQYMEEAKVVAICEVDDAALEENEYVTDEMKIYRDYDEFVHSGLDAVILCNFFHEHAPYAIKAFEAGVAVLSETTAAASLGECVQLVEKCEEHQGTYILLANCPYFTAVHAMKKRIDEGKMGRVLYGEAEYLHYTHVEDGSKIKKDTDLNNLHWRQVLPSNMYNMHTLGTLMYVTGSVPMKVSCKMIRRTDFYKSPRKLTDCNGSVVITEMSNGAVFNTTGC
ncbi:MAG: Gfo/Idh/MocA family oxidoreductase, partial [Clostridia bacterium]|nr:Gfo/Idh/MocA family oxidoreductase [Clostridia bacterium]